MGTQPITMSTTPGLCWIKYDADSDFPIQNIPYGVFSPPGSTLPRCGTRVGDTVIDLSIIEALLPVGCRGAFQQPRLNEFMALGPEVWKDTRAAIQYQLTNNAELQKNEDMRNAALHDVSECTMHLPAKIGDYTDFYASREHATNVGTMFRDPNNALLPNWLHLPVGYHGRASTVVVSGTPITRPAGQVLPTPDAKQPVHKPCRLLDFEVELGFFVGTGNKLGEPMSLQQAKESLFGVVLMNDWSARDIQKWEYVPLGPFGAKNFGTTISPWVVTMEALEPFSCHGPTQEEPKLLDYLQHDDPQALNIDLSCGIQAPGMDQPHIVCNTNSRAMYYSMAQQLCHHSLTGCNMQPGDLLGTGTISGDSGPSSYGSMLEISWKGTKPVAMPDGSERKFIQNGDTVVMRGVCKGDGFNIGFVECTGTLLPNPMEQ